MLLVALSKSTLQFYFFNDFWKLGNSLLLWMAHGRLLCRPGWGIEHLCVMSSKWNFVIHGLMFSQWLFNFHHNTHIPSFICLSRSTVVHSFPIASLFVSSSGCEDILADNEQFSCSTITAHTVYLEGGEDYPRFCRKILCTLTHASLVKGLFSKSIIIISEWKLATTKVPWLVLLLIF